MSDEALKNIILCISVTLAYILDLLFGDPLGKYHPVCIIGKLISFLDDRLNEEFDSPGKQILKGILTVFIVILACFAFSGGIIYLCYRFAGKYVLMIFAILISDSCIALKSMKKEALNVVEALDIKGTEAGRKAVSRIVGRDTSELDDEGILKAAVESVAESTCDGVVAPLFYLLVGGPVLAFIYKAVSTMDSMLGYKNDKYLYFGRAAALLDDLFNFIPSRISALAWCLAAFICGEDGKGAFRIWLRDRYNHESPNSAQTESACAGSLGIRLGGNAVYFGVLKEKPYIGDEKRSVQRQDVSRACRLMQETSFIVLGAGLIIRMIILYFVQGIK